MEQKSRLKQAKEFGLDVLGDIVGSGLYALGINVFTAPNQIAPGGVTGVATVINHLTNVPIGTLNMLINIPLLLIAYKILGKKFALNTVKTTFILSFMLDFMAKIVPTYQGDRILAGLFGGVLLGGGLSIVYMRGSTSGGTDILSRLVKRKMPHFQMGKILLGFDIVILTTAALVYQNIESGMYGLIAIFTYTKVIDSVLYGLDKGKLIYIFSDKPEPIAKEIMQRLGRGVTYLHGVGAYTHADRTIMLCAARSYQFPIIKKIVYERDDAAMVIVGEVGEIIGNGFQSKDKNL